MTHVALPLALVALLALSGCALDTTCEATSSPPTGDLAADILGIWDGFGTDSRLVYVFEADGAFRWVEPPNMYAPEGLQNGWDYTVDGDIVTFEYADGEPSAMQATVTADTLVLTRDADGENPIESTWSRSSCTGYGF